MIALTRAVAGAADRAGDAIAGLGRQSSKDDIEAQEESTGRVLTVGELMFPLNR
jgi:hypothetical protein